VVAAVAALSAAALGGARGATGADGAAGVTAAADDAPKKGTPCASVALPPDVKLPDAKDCKVTEAHFTPVAAVILWAAEGGAKNGVVAWDRGSPGSHPAALELGDPFTAEVRDVTGDGVDDVLLHEAGRGADGDGDDYTMLQYRLLARRLDGFGDAGAYFLASPEWKRGELDAEFMAGSGPPESFHFKWNGYRFVRIAPGEKKVEGVVATASSSLKGYPAKNAVDADPKTTWTEGKPDEGMGERVTLALPRKVTIARVSFATGYDAISPKWGDLWFLNNRLTDAQLVFDGDVTKNLTIDPGARWVDYIPHGELKTKKVTLRLGAVVDGAKWNDTCVNEIEVYER
jgi:hypothetical protein